MFHMTTYDGRMTTAQAISAGLTEAVRDSLKEAGLSQREAASRTGIPLVTLNRRLQDGSKFTAIELGVIAETCGTSLVDLALKAERFAMAITDQPKIEKVAS